MFPTVRLIETQEEAKRAVEFARQDHDGIDYPTHVVLRNTEIIGAATLGSIPLCSAWHHSEKINVRESLHLKQVYDSIMETKGLAKFIMACNKYSPYNQHMKKLGYVPIWETELFFGGTKV